MDDLDFLKSSYHHEVMEAEDELWNGVLDKMAFVARAKMDVHDKVSCEFALECSFRFLQNEVLTSSCKYTAKSNDPSLEPLLNPVTNTIEEHAPFPEGTILNTLTP